MRPYYPVSGLYRLIRDEDGLQAYFMATIHGFRSFAELRAASERFDLGGHALLIAGLPAIVRSKRAARRPRDKAVLDIPEMALHEKEARDTKAKLAALNAESDRALIEMIRRLLDKPIEQRTHFLRKRIAFFRGSCL